MKESRPHPPIDTQTAELAAVNAALHREIAERLRAEQVSRGQMAALSQALKALGSFPKLETFLGQVAGAIAEQLHTPGISVWLHEPAKDCLSIHIAVVDGKTIVGSDLDRFGFQLVQPASESALWQEIVETREPLVVDDVATDPRIRRPEPLLQHGAHSLLIVPLILGEETIGWFGIYNVGPRRYKPEELDLAKALAQQATLAVQMARLAEQGRRAAVLEERNRMAREIHDTLAQGFTGILVQLQAAEIVLTRSPEKALSFISRARELARESLGDARRSVWALRTHVLDSGSLADALGHLLDSMVAGTSIRSDFRVEGEPITLSPTIQAGFLRIGQEAMTNVVRYAEATQLVIALEFRSDQVSLSVRDDGKGFTMGDRPRGSGFGLIGMRERAVEIGAILLIDTRVGSGTEVRVTVAYGT